MKESTYLQKIYAIGAKIYAPVLDKLFKFDRQAVIDFLPQPLQEQHILEVGVGTGLNLPFYPLKTQVHGVDFTVHMLNQIQKKNKHNNRPSDKPNNVFLYRTDAGRLPFADQSFDAALTTYVLRVAPDPVAVLQEVSRYVKPGGLFVIYDQFSRGNTTVDCIGNWFKVPLGWGRNYLVEDLIKQTSWKIVHNIAMTSRRERLFNARLVVLHNKQ